MINTDREVCIGCILVWGYERGGSYVQCSHLRVLRVGKFITEGVQCVGLRTRRFVELDHERTGGRI